ncbi:MULTISPECIES: hypothetical protein [unclassified Nocardioides]|uniref:hypothetical protein n=1 Tax=unclassified Nocardioides TaxID=2615069 RepID=UPI0006F630B8|nr:MULTISPECIES: hypothetical protein [unclassified Nocardioides]KRA28180.1 hypothetical protein ASD81_23820 [Nocardioides sp. Root614]KRA86154.1 hypothetical protein ASD84_24060 [Nocardioides sp. Root682]
MSIHRELAALVRQAGPGVLLDASEFRAAFDDFVLEGSASEGDVNLLTDAVRLGALGRVVDQIGQGADPALAVQTQGVRLAQQRGTNEAAGAQWALAVLAFARGDLDEQSLVTRFRAPVDSLPRPGFLAAPPRAPAPAPTVPPPTVRPPSAPPVPAPTEVQVLARTEVPVARTAHAAPPSPPGAPPQERRRRWRRWVAAASIVALLGTGTFVVLASGHEPDSRPPAGDSPDSDAKTIPRGTLVATDQVTPAPLPEPAAMAGLAGGVKVVALEEVQQVGTGADAEVAEPDGRLVAFTLAAGPCQRAKCDSWQELGLQVLVGSTPVALPAGGPTFLVSALIDESVQLQYDALGFNQLLNLADGAPTGENILVLTREERTVDVRGDKSMRPATTDPRVNLPTNLVWKVKVGKAELFFFDGNKAPSRTDRAYLRIDAYYVEPDGDEWEFFDDELRLLGPDGKELPRRNLGTSTDTDPVFVVPAAFTRGTMEIGGIRDDFARGSDGSEISYKLNLPRTSFDVTFPD